MFIRYYLELPVPFDQVEQALLADPGSWLPGMAKDAEDRGERLLVEVGFEVGEDRRLEKAVRIEVGQPVSVPSASTTLPIVWTAARGARAFPRLDADIEVAALEATRTQLSMSARYRPPFGTVGRALDKALMHRVAEATIKDFVDRVAERMLGRQAAVR